MSSDDRRRSHAIVAAAAALLLFATGCASSWSPVGVGLWPSVQFPDKDEDVYGVRLSLLAAENSDVVGLDVSLGTNVCDSVTGLQIALFRNDCKDRSAGIQIAGFLNTVLDFTLFNRHSRFDPRFSGLQVAPVNYAERLNGLQVGLLNAGIPCGLQIGPVNFGDAWRSEPGAFRFVQIGIWNHAYSPNGIQIGLVNTADGQKVWFVPFINISWWGWEPAPDQDE
jgi:hypothetical protein